MVLRLTRVEVRGEGCVYDRTFTSERFRVWKLEWHLLYTERNIGMSVFMTNGDSIEHKYEEEV